MSAFSEGASKRGGTRTLISLKRTSSKDSAAPSPRSTTGAISTKDRFVFGVRLLRSPSTGPSSLCFHCRSCAGVDANLSGELLGSQPAVYPTLNPLRSNFSSCSFGSFHAANKCALADFMSARVSLNAYESVDILIVVATFRLSVQPCTEAFTAVLYEMAKWRGQLGPAPLAGWRPNVHRIVHCPGQKSRSNPGASMRAILGRSAMPTEPSRM